MCRLFYAQKILILFILVFDFVKVVHLYKHKSSAIQLIRLSHIGEGISKKWFPELHTLLNFIATAMPI